jgi:ABC-type arginine transport system ATPase subunit
MVGAAPDRTGPPAVEQAPVKLGITDLSIRYGAHTALQDVTLEVHEHEIFGIIGPANAGKTSFLKAVNRMDLFDGCEMSMGCGNGSAWCSRCRSGCRLRSTTTWHCPRGCAA